MPEETPGQKSLVFAVTGSNNYQAQQGCPGRNLFDKPQEDLQNAGLGALRSGKQPTEIHMDS